MKHINPHVLELVKRVYGENCQLEEATEWSYSVKFGPESYTMVSRFLAEPDFKISASEIRQRWPRMEERERWDLASNFYNKEKWTDNDTEILEIIMRDGSDLVWSCCALATLRHPDRNRAVEFLIERVQRCESEHPPLNYIQALGLAGERRAVPVIRPYYEKYLNAIEAEAEIGVPADIFFGPIPYHAFLAIAGDLFRITRSEEYEQAIRKYFDHPQEQVRYWAEHALDVEGSTTLQRKAEYAKKHDR
jgi:hypothetical protein